MYRQESIVFAVVAMVVALAMPLASADAGQAPFGDKVGAALLNYNRASPMVATGGRLLPGGVAEAKRLGFATIVDLRTAEEGIAEEEAEAAKAGIRYVNIPISRKMPTDEQVAQLAAILDDADRQPVLVHCRSGVRAGAMWTLYRVLRGVPAPVALEEGLTAGLRGNRENAVRLLLGLAPRDQTP